MAAIHSRNGLSPINFGTHPSIPIDSVPVGMSCTHLVSPTDSATEPAAAISRGEGVPLRGAGVPEHYVVALEQLAWRRIGSADD